MCTSVPDLWVELKQRFFQGSHTRIVDPFLDISAYRHLVGQLLYLTNTRSDICYAIIFLSQFLSKPMCSHYQVALRILRYLKGTPGHGLFFPSDSELKLNGFSDSNWASYLESHCSITGYCIYLRTSLIPWKSKK